MSIKVKGLEGVMAQLREVSMEMGSKALAKAGRASFKKVLESAKQLVPVDSGDLREAMVIRVVKPVSSRVDALVVGIQIVARSGASKQALMAAAAFGEAQSKRLPPSRRWHFIELGTKNRAPQPFLRPALDMNSQGVVDDLSIELRKKIAAAVKKASKGK